MSHPFRFYFRDFDLQGQESECLVLRFDDTALTVDLGSSEPLCAALTPVLIGQCALSVTFDYGVIDGLAALMLAYERDDDGDLDCGAFDATVDAILLAIHAQYPLAEVIHVGGSQAGDAWERWSRQQAAPTPTALTLLVNDLGHTSSVEAPAHHDGPMPSPTQLPGGSLANVLTRTTRAAMPQHPSPQVAPRPAGLGLSPCNGDGVLWPDRIPHDALQTLVDAGSDTVWVLNSRARPRPGGGFVTTLKCEDPKRSWARELAWTDPGNTRVTRSGVETQLVYMGEHHVACLALGRIHVVDPTSGHVEAFPRYEGPLAALLPFSGGVLARTTNAKGKDVVALLNVADSATHAISEVELNCNFLVAVLGLPVAIGYTERAVWCIALHAGTLRLSPKLPVKAESVTMHAERTLVRDEDDEVHEIYGITEWVASLS